MKNVLPAGMTFPYDFVFLPQTIAADGDAIDVLLLMDESAYPGCLVPSRLIGVIEGEQIDGKKRIRNDRLVAVADANHMYANIRRLKDLPSKWLEKLQVFFVNYHNLEGKKYKLLGCQCAETARELIHKSQKNAKWSEWKTLSTDSLLGVHSEFVSLLATSSVAKASRDSSLPHRLLHSQLSG